MGKYPVAIYMRNKGGPAYSALNRLFWLKLSLFPTAVKQILAFRFITGFLILLKSNYAYGISGYSRITERPVNIIKNSQCISFIHLPYSKHLLYQ